jgi:hypothetical protein
MNDRIVRTPPSMDVVFGADARRLDKRPYRLVAALEMRSKVGAVLGLAAALLLAAWMWGFTVDDALISIRYARHVASGVGYRFNVDGPATDGVTPLPWAFLLAPFAHADALTVLERAKCLGLGAWLGAAAAFGVAVARAPAVAWVKGIAFAVLALSVPLAAHAVSGMETGLAIALATVAALSSARPLLAAGLAGAVSTLRPEMGAWALTIGVGFELARDPRLRPRLLVAALLAVGPFALCAIVRVVAFGSPAPLSLLAKPSDLWLGAIYVGAAVVVALTPLLVLSPVALVRAPRPALVLAVAGVAHFGALMAVGGDWMPYARLAAPIVPSFAYAFVLAAPHAHVVATLTRGGAALTIGVLLILNGGTSGRAVGADRSTLIAAARPLLVDARRVAVLDIGWLSAATDAHLVDLAGVTDPTFAVLPGGHTSKRVDGPMLGAPDAILLYLDDPGDAADWQRAVYPRDVDYRLAHDDYVSEHYKARAYLPLGVKGTGYVVLRRAD